ncbi:MAG: molecular chaperone Hsp33 [Verrucomicrobiales bacterium]|jgi:molecular chaperone Hsp33
MVSEQEIENSRIEVRSYFVRERNALLVRAEFSPIYVDYYLHLMQHSLKPATADDAMMKDALAAIALHVTAKPWRHTTAWTLHFEDPLLNIFVTGDGVGENIVGRVFSDGVKETGHGLFYSQTMSPQDPVQQSNIEISGRNVFSAVEQYYKRSEQLRARLFRYSEEDIVMISAQPQCDLEWLESLDDAAVRELDEKEELSILEKRFYRFDCGCSVDKMFPALVPIIKRDGIDEFFAGDAFLKTDCPRCGAKFEITREDIEAFLD